MPRRVPGTVVFETAGWGGHSVPRRVLKKMVLETTGRVDHPVPRRVSLPWRLRGPDRRKGRGERGS